MVLKKKATKTPTKKIAVKKGKNVDREIEIPISDNREVQDGVSSKGKMSNPVPEGYVTIGTQVGVTINMGDFQSARIDVFMQRNVIDEPEAIEAALDDISETIHGEISRQSDLLE